MPVTKYEYVTILVYRKRRRKAVREANQEAHFTNARMHLFNIQQCSIVHISVLNGALLHMEQLHSGICGLGQLTHMIGSIRVILCFQGNSPVT